MKPFRDVLPGYRGELLQARGKLQATKSAMLVTAPAGMAEWEIQQIDQPPSIPLPSDHRVYIINL
ncbi:MAG TPA: hypothetical protein VMB80_01790 [Candidatus Acidoferrum sp.]|nr:hypothetical protein [Candidatus Acidoferrum sp.]